MKLMNISMAKFYWTMILVVIAGVLLGVLLTSYIFYKNRDRLLAVTQARTAALTNTNLTPAQIQKATTLTSGRTIFGTVLSKESGQFTMATVVQNPLDTKNSPIVKVPVPFDSKKDQILIVKQVPTAQGSSGVKEINGTFADIKTGQQVLVRVLSDKKVVYLAPASK